MPSQKSILYLIVILATSDRIGYLQLLVLEYGVVYIDSGVRNHLDILIRQSTGVQINHHRIHRIEISLLQRQDILLTEHPRVLVSPIDLGIRDNRKLRVIITRRIITVTLIHTYLDTAGTLYRHRDNLGGFRIDKAAFDTGIRLIIIIILTGGKEARSRQDNRYIIYDLFHDSFSFH